MAPLHEAQGLIQPYSIYGSQSNYPVHSTG